MKIVEHQIVQFYNSSTSNRAASNRARLNSATSNSIALKATTLNSGTSLIKAELFWKLNVVTVVAYITAQQTAQYVAH